MLKVERAGDVLVDAVSVTNNIFLTVIKYSLKFISFIQTAGKSGTINFAILQRPRSIDIGLYAWH